MRCSSLALSLPIALFALACDGSEPIPLADGGRDAALDEALEADTSPSLSEPDESDARNDTGEVAPDDAQVGIADAEAQALDAEQADTSNETDGEAQPDADSAHTDADAAADTGSAGDSSGSADDGSDHDTGAPDASTQPDACGAACNPPAFTPVRFSSTDRSACARVSDTGFDVEFTDWGPCGVRSDSAIEPDSGVFYVEGLRLTPRYRGGGLGLATAQVALDSRIGASAQSLGVIGTGALEHSGATCTGSTALDPALPELGIVVDYRGASPILHFLQSAASGGVSLAASCTMPVSVPVYLFYSGDRAKVGPELHINTGADTTNFPFHFNAAQVRAALDANTASALVMGFGKTHAAPVDTPPSLQTSADVSVALGQSVTLGASASDTEDGALDAAIQWLDLASPHHAPVRGQGASFSFTPTSIGRHPIVVSVHDAAGLSASHTVMLTVTGALPQAAPVQLVRDALTGEGLTLSADALSVSFNGTGKDGIRANQGLYGKFWYFEVHRNTPIRNMGIGLVTPDGALNPYEPARVPWSCSLNVMHGFWINLLEAGDWPKSDADTNYGLAVDYRGVHPLVHILIGGKLQTTLTLTDVWLPVYPMVYGNPPDAPLTGHDMTLNFGATPFAMDAKALLTAAGVDAAGLELGWGLSVAEAK